MKKSIVEELKDNFNYSEIATREGNVRIVESEWCRQHNIAIEEIIKKMKKEGVRELKVPIVPQPFVIKYSDKYKARILILCK